MDQLGLSILRQYGTRPRPAGPWRGRRFRLCGAADCLDSFAPGGIEVGAGREPLG